MTTAFLMFWCVARFALVGDRQPLILLNQKAENKRWINPSIFNAIGWTYWNAHNSFRWLSTIQLRIIDTEIKVNVIVTQSFTAAATYLIRVINFQYEKKPKKHEAWIYDNVTEWPFYLDLNVKVKFRNKLNTYFDGICF